MNEPRLEDISDYNLLKGEKKRIVYSVIIAGIFIGVLYLIAYNIFDNKEDNLEINESVKIIPLR
ncbi:MAG: hypothetical protein U9P38_04125 [Campylobacterota bacterium]|nr:hypothetical protein [Campylobacterota bacterium]